MTDLHQARIFLANLHGAAVDDGGHHLVIWTLQDKSTRTFQSTDEAAEYAVERADSNCDVYHGLCPLEHPPKSGRGLESDVAIVCHLWLDLDVQSDVHKSSTNYCPSIADGLTWLDQLDHKPSIIVHSGHGLQVYWMLRTPIRIGNDDDRAAAKAITIGWINRLKAQCEWDLDPVSDLSRIFRIPGTVNAKGDTVVPVAFVSKTWAQYSLEELFDGKVPQAVPVVKVSGLGEAPPNAPASDLYPNKDAGIPLAVVKMCEADTQFKKTWNKKRKDLKSASEYDMSLCSQLLIGDAPDQMIANALYAWRSIHSEDTEKLFRKPGPRGTLIRALIDKCRATMKHCATFGGDLDIALKMDSDLIAETAYVTGNLPETTPHDTAPATTPPKGKPKTGQTNPHSGETPAGGTPAEPESADQREQQKQKVFAIVSEKLGIKLLEVLQMGKDDAIYNFRIQNGKGPVEVRIGNGSDLISARRCRSAIVNQGVLLPIMKDATWSTIIKAILPFVEHRKTSGGSRIDEYTHAIEEYLGSEGAVTWDNRLEAMNQCKPFISRCNSLVCVYLFDVLRFINTKMTLGRAINKLELSDGITQIGFRLGDAEYNAGGIHKRMSYWLGPISLLPERS